VSQLGLRQGRTAQDLGANCRGLTALGNLGPATQQVSSNLNASFVEFHLLCAQARDSDLNCALTCSAWRPAGFEGTSHGTTIKEGNHMPVSRIVRSSAMCGSLLAAVFFASTSIAKRTPWSSSLQGHRYGNDYGNHMRIAGCLF